MSFAEIFGIRKLRVPGLSCSVICVILRLAVSVEHRLVTDRQTDRQTHDYAAHAALAWRRAVKTDLHEVFYGRRQKRRGTERRGRTPPCRSHGNGGNAVAVWLISHIHARAIASDQHDLPAATRQVGAYKHYVVRRRRRRTLPLYITATAARTATVRNSAVSCHRAIFAVPINVFTSLSVSLAFRCATTFSKLGVQSLV